MSRPSSLAAAAARPSRNAQAAEAAAHHHWQAGQQARQRHQLAHAAEHYAEATRLAPQAPLYWMSLATARSELQQLGAAQAAAHRAVVLQPDAALPRRVLAAALSQQHLHAQAAEALDGLPPEVPRDTPLLLELGQAMLRAGRPDRAAGAYLQALQQDMFQASAHLGLGTAFLRLQRPQDAVTCLQTAMLTDKAGPLHVAALALLVQQLQAAVAWPELPRHTAALLERLDALAPSAALDIAPFSLLTLPCTRVQQHQVARLAAQRLGRYAPLPAAPGRKPGRLRVGYLSSDFCEHATAMLLVEVLEQRDTARFEVFLYCHSEDDGSALQRRIRAACDQFHDVRALSDAETAQRMREDGVDIAVDLKGHTQGTRLQVLSHRPAPVQIGFLGFPGTSGTDYLDYIVGDAVVTPLAHADGYSERIAQLPHSYQPNDRQRALPAPATRAEAGLPEGSVVLCCFNQLYKISPAMADLWARILTEAPQTVLWLLTWDAQAAGAFAHEMQARGIAPERLFFSPKLSPTDHLRRLPCADLFLDTWPCNAHTTASEALWAGVPVLTVPGNTFASRVAASLVHACGLPELVCDTPEAYVATAVALAGDPLTLRRHQRHLSEQRRQLPLFNSARYTRDYEALLLRMWQRHDAGLAPDHLPAAAAAQD